MHAVLHAHKTEDLMLHHIITLLLVTDVFLLLLNVILDFLNVSGLVSLVSLLVLFILLQVSILHLSIL